MSRLRYGAAVKVRRRNPIDHTEVEMIDWGEYSVYDFDPGSGKSSILMHRPSVGEADGRTDSVVVGRVLSEMEKLRLLDGLQVPRVMEEAAVKAAGAAQGGGKNDG